MVEDIEIQEGQDLLEDIFQHILIISKGECQITDETLSEIIDEKHFKILAGLQMLHEDLTLYKKEFKAKVEAEFQLKVLKKRNEELDQFNHVASHDLQEPLRTIQSFSRLLLKKNFDQLDKEGKVYLNYLNESSNRMSELIHGLLHYSKVGKSVDFIPIDCNQIIQGVLKDLTHTIQQSKPIIDIQKLPVVLGNKIYLHQVFQNLIVNSLKFKQKNKPLHLKISVDSSTKEHIFCFEDNGIGIQEEYFQKIFGIFQRLHSKSEFEGTGIGLALCKKIIEMHNGQIWVESKDGVGSKFYIQLPKSSCSLNDKAPYKIPSSTKL